MITELPQAELEMEYGRVTWQLRVLEAQAAPLAQAKAAIEQELARRFNESQKPAEGDFGITPLP